MPYHNSNPIANFYLDKNKNQHAVKSPPEQHNPYEKSWLQSAADELMGGTPIPPQPPQHHMPDQASQQPRPPTSKYSGTTPNSRPGNHGANKRPIPAPNTNRRTQSKISRTHTGNATGQPRGHALGAPIPDSQSSGGSIQSQLGRDDSAHNTGGESMEVDPVQHSQVSSTADLSVDGDMSSLPGTGQGQGGSGDGNAGPADPVYAPERPFSSQGTKLSRFRKVHRFMTFGLAHSFIAKNLTLRNRANNATTTTQPVNVLTTFLADIPWDKPYLYMTPAEYNLLGPGAVVKSVNIKIVHRGNRIAFETAASTTQLATLNNIQNIACSYGLNKTSWGMNIKPNAFNTTYKMIVSDFELDNYNDDYIQNWYGLGQTQNTDLPDHQLGYKTLLRRYFALVAATYASAAAAPQDYALNGWPSLHKHLQFYDGKTTINQVIGEFEYTPNNGLIKRKPRYKRFGVPMTGQSQTGVADMRINVNRNDVLPDIATINGLTASDNSAIAVAPANVTRENVAYSDVASTTENDLYRLSIEKAGHTIEGSWGPATDKNKIQPSIHIGIQPIPALTTDDLATNSKRFTDCQADWEVFAEMIVQQHNETEFPLGRTSANVGDIPFGAQDYVVNDTLRYENDNCIIGNRVPLTYFTT